MKFFVPACGDRIILMKPWTFPLYLEKRNMQFAKVRGLVDAKADNWMGVREGDRWTGKYKSVSITLGAGTIIECDRIYIRTFNKSRIHLEEDYDSITWKVTNNGKAVRHGRFWVKLPDCYNIEFELQVDSLYRDRVKVVKEVMES